MKYLHEQLQKINKNLPAMAYVPLLSKLHRNYMVLNIAEQESRLFVTAEKAPYLICIEVFQPQELDLHIQELQAKKRPRAFEILNQLNMINSNGKKLTQKINYELSKGQYINESSFVSFGSHQTQRLQRQPTKAPHKGEDYK